MEYTIEKIDGWKKLISVERPQGALKLSVLIKVIFLMWQRNLGAFWEMESELRNEESVRKFIGLNEFETIPQAMVLSHSYILYSNSIKDFKQQIVALFENFKVKNNYNTILSAEEFINSGFEYINSTVYKSEEPYYLAVEDVKSKKKRVCSGGCIFELYEANKNYAEMSVTRKYRSTIRFLGPFQAATRMNMIAEKPIFDEKSVCKKYERLYLGKGDEEGGLRTEGIYKKNTEEMPLITYITVVYNRCETILRCMESVWAQEYPNIEYIVIDGKSSDGTLDIIKEHADKIDYYVSQPDTGIYNAMNKGISLATGSFLCFMNSDDVCTPNAAKSIIECYRKTGASIINGLVNLRDENGTIRRQNYVKRVLIKDNVMRYEGIMHQALYGKKEVFNKIGYFDEDFRGAADLKWTENCKNAGYSIELIEDVVAIFQMGGFSGKNRKLQVRETCAIFKEKYPELSEKTIWQLYYLFKRSKFLRREIIPAYRKIKFNLKKSPRLRKWMYEISLYMIIEEMNMSKGVMNFHYSKYFIRVKKYLEKIIGKNNNIVDIDNWDKLKGLLEERMYESIRNDKNREIRLKDIYQLGKIKCALNKYERRKIYIISYKKQDGILGAWMKFVILSVKEFVTFGILNIAAKTVEKDYLNS